MMNTNNQVNPISRVDFSKIRRFKSGSKIHKFQTPDLPIKAENLWLIEDWLKTFSDNKFTREQSKTSIPWTPDWKSDEFATVQDLENSELYQDFSRYVKEHPDDPNVLSYLKKLEESTTGNGHDRILFDSDGKLVSNWTNEYDKFRTDHKYGFYHLNPSKGALKPEPEPDPEPEPTPEPAPDPLTFQTNPVRKGTPWTDWAPLSQMLGNNLATNQRVFNDEIKKRFPLQEAPYKQGKVTDNYTARQLRSQLAANLRSRANQNLSSNLEANQERFNQAETQATGLEEQNAIDKAQEFNRTSKELQEISNENNATLTAVANYNRQQNAAAWNNLLTARLKLNTANAAELNSYIGNMYSSHGQWLQNERMEDARFQRDLNDYNYQEGLLKLYADSGLENLEKGVLNSQAFNKFREIVENDGKTYGNIPLDDNGLISDQALLEYISSNQNDENVKSLMSSYQQEIDSANKEYESKLRELAGIRTRANMQLPATFSNQGTRFGDRYIRHSVPGSISANPLYEKSGGKMNARFLDYMNHYQKQLQFDKTETRKTQENLLKKLSRDLDYLDKETLLLLKQIFK